MLNRKVHYLAALGPNRNGAYPDTMKVVAFNGSPRKNGNTNRALELVLEELRAEGIETELVQMGSEAISPCKACGTCGTRKNGRCVDEDDRVNEWIEKAAQADGIIIGSPVYFGSVSAQTKAFIDRVGYVARANGDMFKRKVGAAVAVNRRAGALAAFHEINNFFLIGQMIVVGSTYWNVVTALKPGDVEGDEEGQGTMRNLGRNMAWALKRLA